MLHRPQVLVLGQAGWRRTRAWNAASSAWRSAADEAARASATDTGARRAAASLVDARIAVHQAITAAGRTLADRERTIDTPGVRAVPAPTAA